MKTSKELCNAVCRYQGGNAEAFNDIYELSYRYLYTCTFQVLKNEDNAKDMLQETYLEIIKSISGLKEAEQFLNWAAVIANRKCFAYLKQNKNDVLVSEEENEGKGFFEDIADNEEFIPESVLQDKEKQRLIREIIDNLTDMQRLCIIGFYYNEQKQDEIANELNIPLSTVKSHLSRAKEKIREAVIDLDEKKGTRLYAVAPFLMLFFGMEAEACTVEQMSQAVAAAFQTGTPQAAGISGISSTAKGAGMAVKSKIVIGAAVAVIAAGTMIGVTVMNRQTEGKTVQTVQEEQTDVTDNQEAEAPDTGVEKNLQNNEDTAEGNQEIQEKTDEAVEKNEDMPKYVEFPLLTEYENYGSAFGGVIPVMQNGLWGAINYSGEEIVPCEYMGFSVAANQNGYFVLSNSTFETRTTTLMDMTVDYEVETKEYTLFDSEGNVIYCGKDGVRASGDMYITMNDNPPEGVNGSVTYHRMDGTEVLTVECDLTAIRLNGFYDGISTVYEAPMDEDAMYRIGTVDLQGNVSWVDDPERIENFERYAEFLEQKEEEKKQKAVEAASGITVNGSGNSGFITASPRSPISTMNHGYYVTSNLAENGTYIQIYNENNERITAFNMYYAVPDEAEGFVISKSGNMEQYSFRNYFYDGNWLYNYGPKMVFALGEKDILVDFTKSPGMTEETMNNSIIQAVYDRIYMGDSTYWLAVDESRTYYIDHDGNVIAEYEDATQFYQGYAIVIENGHAVLVNEEFEECYDLGEAQSAFRAGEVIGIQNGDAVTFMGPETEQ